eukprot:TRINITY_DN22813_c0_g1_i2.p2 TRINITY_DN22813_c0_g1~~TRINITY_DN22813_c0_g1_i2.p2  ORF type:complete len:112 (+),score=13.04 TRINITY_DN22813_c0_g1_i2:54-389(+)
MAAPRFCLLVFSVFLRACGGVDVDASCHPSCVDIVLSKSLKSDTYVKRWLWTQGMDATNRSKKESSHASSSLSAASSSVSTFAGVATTAPRLRVNELPSTSQARPTVLPNR